MGRMEPHQRPRMRGPRCPPVPAVSLLSAVKSWASWAAWDAVVLVGMGNLSTCLWRMLWLLRPACFRGN
jgi:hypothetical protein